MGSVLLGQPARLVLRFNARLLEDVCCFLRAGSAQQTSQCVKRGLAIFQQLGDITQGADYSREFLIIFFRQHAPHATQ
jgi:hypothetical protein